MAKPTKQHEENEILKQSGFWSPEDEGESVQGFVIDVVEPKRKNESGWIELDDGENNVIKVNRWSKINLALEQDLICLHTWIRIEYVSKRDISDGRTYHLFKIFTTPDRKM